MSKDQQFEHQQTLQQELKETIRTMERIQRESTNSGQPISGFELERLTQLGHRYGEIIGRLKL
ncbi:MAG: hypothetical protein GKR95_25545 [Gammaproteobacteria bacterium]|nr:hypothetical protein [Gammaproteobacteria bacterium]NKB65321.1 hypothetical protein [Gammaproteobacteria bacterium]